MWLCILFVFLIGWVMLNSILIYMFVKFYDELNNNNNNNNVNILFIRIWFNITYFITTFFTFIYFVFFISKKIITQ